MNVNMDDLVKEAMFRSLDQEKRDALIKEALSALLQKERRQYGADGPTPLQEAFNREARALCQKLVHEMLNSSTPEAAQLQASIRNLIVLAWQKALAEPDVLVDNMAKVISKALEPKDRY